MAPSLREPPLGDDCSSSSSKPTEHVLTENVQRTATTVDATNDKEKAKADLVDRLIQYMYLLLQFHKKKGHEKPPTANENYWLAISEDAKRLKEILKGTVECTSALGDIISCKDSTQMATNVVREIAHINLAAAGLLVVANVLEKLGDVSDNTDECISLLDEMHKFGIYLTNLGEHILSKEAMKIKIEEATEKIVKGSLICSRQRDMVKILRFLLSSVNKKKLQDVRKELDKAYRQIDNGMGYCILNALHCAIMRPLRKKERPCPRDAVGIDEQLKTVSDLLEWKEDIKVRVVILHGLGGTGKSTLADAVFARLYRKDCRYSMVRFDEVSSDRDVVEVQKFMVEDLMIDAEGDVTSTTQLEIDTVIRNIRYSDHGQKVIADILEKHDVFIYIDNASSSNIDLLQKLLPESEDMKNAKKLRLLITSQDKDIRTGCRIEEANVKFHLMECLSNTAAEDFLKKELQGQIDSVQREKIVNICGGIPGLWKRAVDLINYSADSQKYAFENVEEKHVDNIKKCVFCYMDLPANYRGPFLDICMFFNGWDWNTVENIVGNGKLRALEKKALVSNTNNKLKVHDVVLEMGREMESKTEFNLQSRKGEMLTPILTYDPRRNNPLASLTKVTIVKLGILTEAKDSKHGKIFQKILYVEEDSIEVSSNFKGKKKKPKRSRNRR